MIEEDVGNGWKRYIATKVLVMNRTGFNGLCDRLVSWWTGKPQRTVNVEYIASVCAKNSEMAIKTWGGQLEEGPDQT